MMKYLIILFSIILFADEPKLSVEQLFSVGLTEVKKVTTSKVHKNYGYVKVDESKVYSVTPRFGGYIEVLYADAVYKHVNKGEKLAKVYSPEVLSAKEEYLASIKYTKSRDNKEMLEGSKDKLILLNVDQKEIDSITKSKKVSKYTYIYSPASGYVFKKNISNFGAFNAKQKLFEIVDLDTVWVEAKIHQKELSALESMQDYEVTASGIDEVFKAKKAGLYPKIAQNEATLTQRLYVNNPMHLLKEGMYVSVESRAKASEHLTLPSSAVIRKNGRFYVFVAGEYEGEYEPTEVEVEVLNSTTYIVSSGLANGDFVVNNALFMMDSDAQINGLY